MGIDRAVRGRKGLLAGFPVGWFAPDYKLLKQAWRDIRDTLREVTRSVSDQDKRIELINGSVLECWAFDRNPDAGRSRRYGTIIIDEAAHCDHLETAWGKAIRPTLTDYEGDAWFISSPNGPNFFHKLYQRGLSGARGWRSWTQTSYDNPHIKPTEIDSARDDIGDWAFDQEYMAVFHAEANDGLLKPFWVDRLPQVAAECDRLRSAGKGGRRILSADLGEGTGRDRTVIMVRDSLGVLFCLASDQVGIPEAAGLISAKSRDFDVRQEDIVYDKGGRGKDLAGYLEHYQITDARGYHGSGLGGQYDTNKRTRVAWLLRQRLDPARPLPPKSVIVDPDHKPSIFEQFEVKPGRLVEIQPPFAWHADLSLWASLAEELKALRYSMKGPKRALELKEDMAKRLGRSPDLVDALLMSFAQRDDA